MGFATDAFTKWLKENKENWDDFIKWYSSNMIQVDLTHKFYRGQY
jgi:hypothetical protein